MSSTARRGKSGPRRSTVRTAREGSNKDTNGVRGRVDVGDTAPIINAADAIFGIPDTLRDELLARFNDTVRNYRNGHWEAATLNAGKFCEVVYSILKGRADGGAYPARAEKPRDMVQACRNLENADEKLMGGRALRIQIPRAIPAVYEIRNNRGTGHAGAEVDPNHMDAEYVLSACQWMLADLVRAYHKLAPAEAQRLVETLTERTVPLIWDVGGVKRVLAPDMGVQERVLVLLYGTTGAVQVSDLCRWSEYKNITRFRDDILGDMHTDALINFDTRTGLVAISPLGQRRVEKEILSNRVLMN